MFRRAAAGGSPPPPPPPPAPAPSGPGASFTGHTVNLQTNSFWNDPWGYINMMRFARGYFDYKNAPGNINTGPSYENAQGWFTSMPANEELGVVLMVYGADKLVQPGNYVVHCYTAGVVCRAQSGYMTGVTNLVEGTGTSSPDMTFTVPTSQPSGVSLWFRFKNESGAAVNITDIYCGLVSNKTAYDGGEIFDPAWLAQLGSPVCIRFNDWLSLNPGPNYTLDPLEIPTEANAIWCPSNRDPETSGLAVGKKFGTPPSVIAKLCQRLSSVCWFAVPGGNLYTSDYSAAASTNRVTSTYGTTPINHNLTDGDKIVFGQYAPSGLSRAVVYYVRDSTAQTFRVAATLGGTALTITGDTAPNYNRKLSKAVLNPYLFYVAYVNALVDTWSGITLVGEYGNESWNPTYNWDYLCRVGPLVSQTYSAGGGVAYSTPPSDGDYTTYAYDGGRAWAWHLTMLWKAIEARVGRSKNIRILLQQGANPGGNGSSALSWVSTDYSPGTTFGAMLDGFAMAPYMIPTKSNQDEVAAGALTWTDAQWYQYYRSSIDNEEVEASAHRTNMPSGYTSLPIYVYESSIQARSAQGTLSNTDYLALHGKRIAYLLSATAAKQGGEYINRVHKKYGFQNDMYWQAGNWNNADGYAWGANRDGFAARSGLNQGVIDEWATATTVPPAPPITLANVGSVTQDIDVGYSKWATSYRVEKRLTTGPGAWGAAAGTWLKTVFTATGLTAGGTSYDYRAFANNSFGDSAASNTVTQVTDNALVVLFSDNFNGADATLTGYTFTGGTTWGRSSNHCAKTSTSATGAILKSVSAAKYLQADQIKFAYHEMSFFFRYVDANNYWRVRLSTNINNTQLLKVVGGVSTVIGETAGNFTNGNDSSQTPTQTFRVSWKDSTQAILVTRTVAGVTSTAVSVSGVGSDLANGGILHGFYSDDANPAYCFFDNLEIGG